MIFGFRSQVVKKKRRANTNGAEAKMTRMAMVYSIDVLCTVSD